MRPALRILNRFPYSATFLLGILVYHGSSIVRWMRHLPSSTADGLKNYFTLAYHVMHDSNPFWFRGMNYPYGEHLVYTDGQPLFGVVLWFLDVFLPISSWLPWLVPLILVGSFYAGGWFLFRILSSEKRRPWLAAAFATAIMLLSPQWIRFGGHYSLAHAVVIPMVFYLLWRQHHALLKNHWLLLALVLVGFIHPYFTAMCSALVLLYQLIAFLAEPRRLDWSTWIRRMAVPVGALILFQGILWLTDPFDHRPDAPFGFLVYRATWRSLLLPSSVGFPEGMALWLEGIGQRAMEGSFYLGMVAILVSPLALIRALTGANRHPLPFELIVLLSSVPILLLSTGWPFTMEPLERFLPYSGPIQQFRGIGRFSWVAFYAGNLVAACYFIKRWDLGRVHRWMGISALLVLSAEGWIHRYAIQNATAGGSDRMSSTLLEESGFEGYAAIVPLPYFHIGSEQFRTPERPEMIAASFDLSLETGIPLLAVQMSRTSLEQTMTNLALTRHIMSAPKLIGANDDQRWLLLVDEAIHLPTPQQHLIEYATRLGAFGDHALYALDVRAYADMHVENVRTATFLAQSAVPITGASEAISDVGYYFQDGSPSTLPGAECSYTINRSDWTSLFPPRTHLPDTTAHELTFWMKADQHGAMNTQVWYWERSGDEDVVFGVTEVGDHAIGFLNGWALCKVSLQVQDTSHTLEVLLHRDGENLDLCLGDILIRPLSTHYFRPTSMPNINNRYYELPSDSSVQKAYMSIYE